MVHRRTLYLFALLCVGQLLLISGQVQTQRGAPVLKQGAFGLFAGVQHMFGGIADGVHGLWSHYFGLRGAAVDNERLRAELLTLRGQLQQETALADRARVLEGLLALKATVPTPTLAARVIAGDPTPGSLTVTIDRGTADGVLENMAVIGPAGVIGRVMGVPAAHAAHVQLLIGRDASAGAVLERLSAGGIVQGGGDPPLQMRYVSTAVDIAAGDRVLTSGQDRMYPAGLLIGTVTGAVKGSMGEYKLVAIRPAVDFSHLDGVLVLLKRESGAGPADK